MNVVLLHDELRPDAREDELDVVIEAGVITAALGELGHTAARLPFSLDLRTAARELRRLRPDVVFNLVESVEGHGRLIALAPALLDSLRIPYTGAGTEAMFTTSGKLLTKRLLQAAGIATPPWFTPADAPDGRVPLPGRHGDSPSASRWIIKSVWEDASLGIEDDSVVQMGSADELCEAIAGRAEQLGGEAFAEAYIPGREFNLSVLAGPDGPEVLPPAEIHFVDYAADRPRVVGYRAKWDTTSFEYNHTPRSFEFPAADRPLLAELCRIARACWTVFGLRGYARVDFRVDDAGRPWVLEINANPCLSPDAGFPEAAACGGLAFPQVIARLLADARCGGAAMMRRQECEV